MTQSYENFRQKIGLDYLINAKPDSPEQNAAPNSADALINQALLTTGNRVIRYLKEKGPSAKLGDITRELNLDVQTMLRVNIYLLDNGFIRAVDNNPELIELTERGTQVPI